MLNFIKPTQDFETFTASLGDGEHFQKLELNSSWFIEKIKLTSNLGNVFGPYGGGGGEDRRPHRTIRKGVNPKHVYLDGVRGYVVRAQGAKALNRVSFKWSFVMDKKISRYSYHHSVVLRPDSERISVLDLERDISPTLPFTIGLVRTVCRVLSTSTSEMEDGSGVSGGQLVSRTRT